VKNFIVLTFIFTCKRVETRQTSTADSNRVNARPTSPEEQRHVEIYTVGLLVALKNSVSMRHDIILTVFQRTARSCGFSIFIYELSDVDKFSLFIPTNAAL